MSSVQKENIEKKEDPTQQLEEGEVKDEDIPKEALEEIDKIKELKRKEDEDKKKDEKDDDKDTRSRKRSSERDERHSHRSSSSRHSHHHHSSSSSSSSRHSHNHGHSHSHSRSHHHHHHSPSSSSSSSSRHSHYRHHSRRHHHHSSDSDSDSDYDRHHSSHHRHDDKKQPEPKPKDEQTPNTDSDPKPVTNTQSQPENPTNNATKSPAPNKANAKPSLGLYMPPSRLREMQKEITDKNSAEYQRLSWEALKKSINAIANKVSASNIKEIVPELFRENLERGRGLFCRTIITAQHASPGFTPVYAALVAIVNTRVQEIGELLLHRLVDRFNRAYRRNNREMLITTVTFIAHLLNQQVCTPTLALEICVTLLESSSEDGIEVAAEFIQECGYCLKQDSAKGFTRSTSRRIQYRIEALFKTIKDDFVGHQGVPPELDIVEEGDQNIHNVDLETKLDLQEDKNYFKFDPNFEENEQRWKEMRQAILGESDSENDSSDDEDADDADRNDRHREYVSEDENDSGEEGDDDDGEGSDDETVKEAKLIDGKELISDQTSTDLINLRKSIYLTFMSGLSYEEAVHKILCIEVPPEKRIEICRMTLECCAQARTYDKYYALVAERFCHLDRDTYTPMYEQMFREQYADAHHLDTNKLRSTAKFFAHLLHSDAISWTVMECIHLSQEETNAASRIFIKNIFLDVAENLGLLELKARVSEEGLQPYLAGLFPKNDPKKTRFAINFFTAIGLGGLTDDLREHLKSTIVARTTIQSTLDDDDDDDESELSSSSSSSSSSSDSDSNSDSDSDSDSSMGSELSSDSSSSSSSSDSSSSSKSDSEDKKSNSKHKSKSKSRSRSKSNSRSYSDSDSDSITKSPKLKKQKRD